MPLTAKMLTLLSQNIFRCLVLATAFICIILQSCWKGTLESSLLEATDSSSDTSSLDRYSVTLLKCFGNGGMYLKKVLYVV